MSGSYSNDGIVALGMALMLFYVVAIGFSILTYVLGSLGSYTIASRRTIKHPWLAWVPVGSSWLLGCISDQYQYVVKGKVTNRRKILLAVSIVSVALSLVTLWQYMSIVLRLMMNGEMLDRMTEEQAVQFLTRELMPIIGVLAGTGLASIVATVFIYISLFDLYRSCDPDNAVMFLILSVVFNITQPFFIFACRKKDGGMPPRRMIPPQQPTWQSQPPVPPQDPFGGF